MRKKSRFWKLLPFFYTLLLLNIGACHSGINEVKLDTSWQIVVGNDAAPLVKWAAQELATDIGEILGKGVRVVNEKPTDNRNFIFIGKETKENEWEQFKISSTKNTIHIQGTDVRGTVYGIFELAERMGVSPWKWWADVTPEKRSEIEISIPKDGIIESPSVQYRGIFLNDEDWGLHPWAAKTFEPETGDIGPKTYEKIFQLLLRLKANSIWPAMHPCTKAFYKVPDNNEMAQKYHIVVGTSHCEPMLRNNVDEWDQHKNGDYNYFSNQESVCRYWNERIEQVKDAENIVTLGMRGIHDGHMYGGSTLKEKTRMVEQIIDDQRQMLVDIKKKPIDSIITTVVLYKEVLDLYNIGMKIPDDVTIMWCDDNHGYIRRLSNEEEQKRKGGAGVYYHLSYWGAPHDYLWLSTTQPGLIWYEMNKAYQNGAQKIWIANVGDIKPCEYNMELFLDMAWNINSVTETTIDDHTKKWAEREFGKTNAYAIAEIKKEYYRLASIRRPEFMGWNRVEPKTLSKDTDFNPLANGNEVYRRMNLYSELIEKVKAVSSRIPVEKRGAWFQLVEYPVKSAQLMNEKFLYAQLARNTQDKNKRVKFVEKSKIAYHEIEQLTNFYNQEMLDGKWRYMMSMSPRNLNVFSLPDFSQTPSVSPKKQKTNRFVTAIQANEFHSKNGTDGFQWQSIQSLGYSDCAITLFPLKAHHFDNEKPTLEYKLAIPEKGNYELQVRLLPTHSNDRDQIVIVQVDNKNPVDYHISTKGKSEQWKVNILRNHAIIKHEVSFTEPGIHSVKLGVNQSGIVIDQLALSLKNAQTYYEIPTKK